MKSLVKNTPIIVGMSGGVDSSVTAMLLQQQGYQVTGVYMQNWEADAGDPFCSANQDLLDAQTVCDHLKIPFRTVNFSKQYWNNVFQDFLNEYALGNTPNPDILCNKEIKFKAFLHYALEAGAAYIATGHYARSQINDSNFQLHKAIDANKDQSYFLYTLTQSQLKYSLFPLGELTKTKVRELAKQAGLLNHAKKDSTGICFIGERKFKSFLGEYLLAKPGNIETEDKKVIGQHQGLMFHTLGQRQGLGIGGKKMSQEKPWYVIGKDLERNVLVVAQEHQHPRLLSKTLTCKKTHWITADPIPSIICKAKTRYRHQEQPCKVTKMNKDEYLVEFEQSQWAITPGQSVVFYENDICLGGGIIS